MKIRIILPVKGTVIEANDNSFSGDPANPIDIISPDEISYSLGMVGDTPRLNISDRVYDLPNRECEVTFTFQDDPVSLAWLAEFSTKFAALNKTPDEIRAIVTNRRMALDPDSATSDLEFRLNPGIDVDSLPRVRRNRGNS